MPLRTISVSNTCLQNLMRLPEHVTIRSASWDADVEAVVFVVDIKGFPELEGAPRMTVRVYDRPVFEFIDMAEV